LKNLKRNKMKETLEETAERLVKETTLYGSQEASIGSSARSYFETELRCVLLGMKWQMERSYSEEEVLEILIKAIKDVKVKQLTFFDGGSEYPIYSNLIKWFKQFKKK